MTVKGRDRLLQKLKKIQGAPRAAIAGALEKGAKQIVATQKSMAPVDSGDLRESIAYTKGSFTLLPAQMSSTAPSRKRRRGPRVIEGDPDLTITVTAGDAKAWYARLVEFGTPPRQQGDAAHPGTAPQPFFYPGYRANVKSVQSRIKRWTRKAIKDGAR